ncbi:MAG: CAP domain-containing protein, partial [Dehalococcoidia bacterium]
HNEMRYAIGAPTIPGDPRVVLAAQRHATYSTLNGTGGHYETAGNPGFTGYGPRERLAAAGWSTAFVSEVAASYTGAYRAVTELWHAPYHRLGMMHPSAIATGWGHSDLNGRSATVGNLVYDFGARAVNFVRSPAHGQTGIPPSWSGNESPSPLPAGVRGPVGYPIMVVYSGGQGVQMRAAELVAPGGARVPFYYVPQLYEYDYQVIIPKAPLAAGTNYHVRMDLTVNGRWVTNEWDFTTAGTDRAAPIARQPTVGLPAASGFHARWVSQSDYPTLRPGETSAPLTITFANTGSATWTRGVLGRQVNLGIDGDDRTWSSLGVGWPTPDRVAIQDQATVLPGATGSFTFRVRAPQTPGTYRIHLRPVVDGTTWLEDYGVFLVVTVK